MVLLIDNFYGMVHKIFSRVDSASSLNQKCRILLMFQDFSAYS